MYLGDEEAFGPAPVLRRKRFWRRQVHDFSLSRGLRTLRNSDTKLYSEHVRSKPRAFGLPRSCRSAHCTLR